jgi:lipoyl(octanoyl) transferase
VKEALQHDARGIMQAAALGLRDYTTVWHAMQRCVERHDQNEKDQLWLTEHPAVYTLGLNGRREHLLNPGSIPVIHCDRGGQVTYHGPGQLLVYTLIDLDRRKLNVKLLVRGLERALLSFLLRHGIEGELRSGAPGVYVGGAKIASLGLRIKNGMSYHGLSLNVDMDLEPFTRINPCGFANLPMTSLAKLGVVANCGEAGWLLAEDLRQSLGYDSLVRADLPQWMTPPS